MSLVEAGSVVKASSSEWPAGMTKVSFWKLIFADFQSLPQSLFSTKPVADYLDWIAVSIHIDHLDPDFAVLLLLKALYGRRELKGGVGRNLHIGLMELQTPTLDFIGLWLAAARAAAFDRNPRVLVAVSVIVANLVVNLFRIGERQDCVGCRILPWVQWVVDHVEGVGQRQDIDDDCLEDGRIIFGSEGKAKRAFGIVLTTSATSKYSPGLKVTLGTTNLISLPWKSSPHWF